MITAITDSGGFFIFLGLATLFLKTWRRDGATGRLDAPE